MIFAILLISIIRSTGLEGFFSWDPAKMAGESVIPENQCPIIAAWSKLDGLVARAVNGRIADVGKELDRQAVSDNAEVLAPLLKEFGTLTQSK